MTRLQPATAVAGSLTLGLAWANVLRGGVAVLVLAALALAALFVASPSAGRRLVLAGLAAAALGWWWGSVRLVALDRSPLAPSIGRAGYAHVEVTGAARTGAFAIRIPARARMFDGHRVDEPVELELPLGRAPPQGALLDALVVVRPPAGPADGFDERAWLRHQGVHVVLEVDSWHAVGRRGGLRGRADSFRRWLRAASAHGLGGERSAIVEGVLLGDDTRLSPGVKQAFRRAGLYHLLAVSGENVVLLAAGVLGLAWLAGIPRGAAHLGALLAIGAYVVAVGPQPSVLRAAVSGAAASTAWLLGRQRDPWHLFALAAAALLAWNPYLLLDPGFQLSFAAVAAIFLFARPLQTRLEGYALPGRVGTGLAVSVACSAATAPLLLLQFGQVPLLGVVANLLAEPAIAPLLGLAFAAAALDPISPAAAGVLAWLNGWVAVYVAAVARAVAAPPFAQASGAWADVAVAGVLVGAAYAWRRWRTT